MPLRGSVVFGTLAAQGGSMHRGVVVTLLEEMVALGGIRAVLEANVAFLEIPTALLEIRAVGEAKAALPGRMCQKYQKFVEYFVK